ncbi:protein of unknown function [Georgfuchsia toluolica]|uniref:Uncharacterized protein n=2 Tax=Georgfuchsia toluolica TaxID=424218 RepID=A0A916NIN6_9PROT|nr:protein of unknown function [Georgfuchsia toluolica]
MGGKATYAQLIGRLCHSDAEKLHMIPVVWHLVVTRRLEVNLDQPVSDGVRLKLPKTGASS